MAENNQRPSHDDTIFPLDPSQFVGCVHQITDVQQLVTLLRLIQQSSVAAIGIDIAYRYARPHVRVKNELVADIRSIEPTALSLSVQGCEPGFHLALQVPLCDPTLVELLPDLLRLPVPFVGHELKHSLFCLWQLGLPEPGTLWDTCTHERINTLGLVNVNQRVRSQDDPTPGSKRKWVEGKQQRLLLSHACWRFSGQTAPAELDDSSLVIEGDQAIEASLLKTQACTWLYPQQLAEAGHSGNLNHCVTVEMPWIITNARMEWHGVRVDRQRARQILGRSPVLVQRWEERLKEVGIDKPGSHKQLKEYFSRQGSLHLFEHRGKYSFDRDNLKEHKHIPDVNLIYQARLTQDLGSETLLNPKMVASDGRVHAWHRPLTTETGRQGARLPNVLGLNRLLRTLVIPEEGYGIGEVDLSQIEIGITAAVYHDLALISAFNCGDVYAGGAQRVFAAELSEEDRQLDGKAFKARHPVMRDQMKVCTLSLIYGSSPQTMAQRLGLEPDRAREIIDRFLETYPAINKAMTQGVQLSMTRGYVRLVSGLRIYLDRQIHSSTRNRFCMNYPVQGSAAVAFKAAGNRLDKLYQPYGAKLLIPLHDSYIFEAPLEHLEEVAELTGRVMREAVREYFPVLKPRTDINIEHPQCWNKDGDINVFDHWYETGEI